MKRGFIDGEYQDGELRGLGFLAGKRGMGKTTEMARLLKGCQGDSLFFDPLSRHESVLPDYTLTTQPGELKELFTQARGKRRRTRALYQPRSGDVDAHFQAACTIVRAFGSMIFAIDELDMLCGPHHGDKRMPREFSHLVHYGRHVPVSLLATARRPMDVARGFTSQCTSMRLFCMTEEADLKYFQPYIGQENARRIPTLQPYQYLLWMDGQPGLAELRGGRR